LILDFGLCFGSSPAETHSAYAGTYLLEFICRNSFAGTHSMSELIPEDQSPPTSTTPAPTKVEPPIPATRRKRYKKAIAWFIGSGLVAGLGIGAWFVSKTWFQKTPAAIAVMLMPVERGNVELSVTESGVMELGGQQTLKSPREVTVEQVTVKEGDRVQKGQALIILRDRTAQDGAEDQRVENAKVALDLSRRQEKVGEVQERLKVAAARYQESQALLARGFISETELQEDKEKMNGIESELRDAQVEVQKVELDIRKGQEKLALLQQQLGDRIVMAPIAGVVLKVHVNNGDGVQTEKNLLTLGDPRQEIIKLQLTTLNAAKVRVNQLAKVSTIGPDAKTFTGRVISLSPQATVAESGGGGFGGGGGDSGQAKVDAKVVLERPSQTLIPGSLVSVEIITESRQNVIIVSPETIQKSEDESFVWLQDAQNRARKQTVKLGLQGLQQVEIRSGLKIGDRVAVPPPDQPVTPGAMLQEGGEAIPMEGEMPTTIERE
jgi:HlyD family secretion protein